MDVFELFKRTPASKQVPGWDDVLATKKNKMEARVNQKTGLVAQG